MSSGPGQAIETSVRQVSPSYRARNNEQVTNAYVYSYRRIHAVCGAALPCTLGGLGVLCIIRGVEEGVLRGEDAVVIVRPSPTVQVAV